MPPPPFFFFSRVFYFHKVVCLLKSDPFNFAQPHFTFALLWFLSVTSANPWTNGEMNRALNNSWTSSAGISASPSLLLLPLHLSSPRLPHRHNTWLSLKAPLLSTCLFTTLLLFQLHLCDRYAPLSLKCDKRRSSFSCRHFCSHLRCLRCNQPNIRGDAVTEVVWDYCSFNFDLICCNLYIVVPRK